MKVVITGGLGFIGSHVVDKLVAAGHNVSIIDNLSTGNYENIEETFRMAPKPLKPAIHICDIRDDFIEELLKKLEPDVVIHMAAQVSVSASTKEPFNDAEINILGTVNILESMKRTFLKKIIFASSVAVYGQPENIPVKETHRLSPISPYGISKKTGEEYIKLYGKYFDWSILRLGNVFGPRQDPSGEAGVVSIFLDRIDAGRPPEIYGDGKQVRDFVYVKDVANAFIAALDGGSRQVFNIATGKKTSVLELVDAYRKVGKDPKDPKFKDPRQNDIREMILDVSEAESVLGWKPGVELGAGLSEMLLPRPEIPNVAPSR